MPKDHVAAADLATPTDLLRNDRSMVVDALNGFLADRFALFLKTKNFHWNVSGPHFRDYHLMLDDQATQILGTTDAIAERARKNCAPTRRPMGDLARGHHQAANDNEFVSAADMLVELSEDNMNLVAALREANDIV